MLITHSTVTQTYSDLTYLILLWHNNKPHNADVHVQTSSAACLEPRSVSSLWAEGAWERQAGWYKNFLRLWA